MTFVILCCNTKIMLSVSEALATRSSVREFTDQQVSLDLILKIIDEARQTPSGGNVQPWKVYIVHGATKDKLVSIIESKIKKGQFLDGIEYDIYPKNMKKIFPIHYQRRTKVAQDMYDLLGIKRKDKVGRMKHFANNFKFFGAPLGLLFTIPKKMGVAQFSDLGMFILSIMLLCQQYGLSTCSQEAWSLWAKTIKSTLHIDDNELLFCGMSVGYKDVTANVNKLKSERMPMNKLVVIPDIKDNSIHDASREKNKNDDKRDNAIQKSKL